MVPPFIAQFFDLPAPDHLDRGLVEAGLDDLGKEPVGLSDRIVVFSTSPGSIVDEITVDLYNLPADFDLYLFDPSGPSAATTTAVAAASAAAATAASSLR